MNIETGKMQKHLGHKLKHIDTSIILPENNCVSTNKININAGNFRRLLAFIIDTILLGLFVSILSVFWVDLFKELGEYSWIIGFVITLAYFSYTQTYFRGQTIAGKLVGISVVTNKGKYLSIKNSLIRNILLLLLVYSSEIGTTIWLNIASSSMMPETVSGALFISYNIVFLVFLIFHPQRRGIHDLISGAYIVHANKFNTLSQVDKQKYFKNKAPVRKPLSISILLVGFACTVLVLLMIVEPLKNIFFGDLSSLRYTISKNTDTNVKSLFIRKHNESGKPAKILEIQVVVNSATMNDEEKLDQLDKQIKQLAAETYLKKNKMDSVQVLFVAGYNTGLINYSIARSTRSPETKEIKVIESHSINFF